MSKIKSSSKAENILLQINSQTKLGDLRKIAKDIKKDHELAMELWSTEAYLPRLLGILIMDKKLLSQEVLNKYMISKKCGSIINISSIWGITGASMEVAYSTAKAGIIGMSKALAKELGPSNIRVNVIAPGWINTDMTKDYTDEEKEMFISEIPLGRLGEGNDIAGLCYFLASDESSYITGQVISPNGGYLV